jgi:hypothetical protein
MNGGMERQRPNKYAPRKPLVPPMSRVRAAISNGSTLFMDGALDERSVWARRFRDMLRAHVSDCGGDENLSEAERSLIRRATTLEIQLELIEQRIAANEGGYATSAQLNDYQRAANSLRRILLALGTKRRAVDISRRVVEDREAGLVP